MSKLGQWRLSRAVRKLELSPDDTLIVETAQKLGADEAQRISRTLAAVTDHKRIAVLDHDAKLSVVHPREVWRLDEIVEQLRSEA